MSIKRKADAEATDSGWIVEDLPEKEPKIQSEVHQYDPMPYRRRSSRRYPRRKLQGQFKYQAKTKPGEDQSRVLLYGPTWRQATKEQKAQRLANDYYGDGGFFGDAWNGIKSLGKAHGAKALGFLGGALGGPGGAAMGRNVGTALGMGAYRMGGLGAYDEISSNDLVHGGSGDSMSIANVNPSAEDDSGDVYMSHSEFIGNVVATAFIPVGATQAQSTFTNTAYAINPGLQGTFPFLCQLAQNYTMYKLEGVIYQYKPTSGESGGTSNMLGKVIMATDYDPMALPFINSVQMENYQYSQSSKPSLAMRHGVECAPSQGITAMKYVRTGTSNRDKAFTDYGLFQLATEGIPISGASNTTVTNNIGELWVSYRVRLSRANLYASLLGYNIRNDIYDRGISTPYNTISTQIPAQNINVTTPTIEALQNIGTTLSQFIGTSTVTTSAGDQILITWPASQILGVYKITIIYSSTASEVASLGAWNFLPTIPGKLSSDGKHQTQWMCPFLPTINSYGDQPTKPNIDAFGKPILADITEATCGRRVTMCTSEAVGSFVQSQTSFYVAINSPTTTIPKLLCELKVVNQATGASLNVIQNLGIASSKLQVYVEQVNAEISN